MPGAEQKEQAEHIQARLDWWHTKQCCLGVRGLRDKLRKEDGLVVGRKRIKRYMEEMGICPVYPKPNLSKRGKEFHKFPYLLKNKSIFMPNQVWAVDITYIKMGKKHMYLTAIIETVVIKFYRLYPPAPVSAICGSYFVLSQRR